MPLPRRFHLTVALLIMISASPCAAAPYKSEAGPHRVDTRLETWTDAARRRDVPVKMYLPRHAEGLRPIVLFSHGLGGSREGAAYLGRHWASHGYVAVHLQHPGSDRSIWEDLPRWKRKDALKRALKKPRHFLDRPRDVSFAIDRLQRMNENDEALRGRLDTQKIAIAGHSFGAWTALTVAGRKLITPRGRSFSFKEPRLAAAIAMSAPPGKRPDTRDEAHAGIDIPCLHMTGTLDTSPITHTTAEARQLPFKHTPGPDEGGAAQYLLVLKGGDHQVFSGRRYRESEADPDNDPRFHSLIKQASTAMLDAYLRQQGDAKQWLQSGGFAREVGEDGTVRTKP